jgi:hypothetical protein
MPLHLCLFAVGPRSLRGKWRSPGCPRRKEDRHPLQRSRPPSTHYICDSSDSAARVPATTLSGPAGNSRCPHSGYCRSGGHWPVKSGRNLLEVLPVDLFLAFESLRRHRTRLAARISGVHPVASSHAPAAPTVDIAARRARGARFRLKVSEDPPPTARRPAPRPNRGLPGA